MLLIQCFVGQARDILLYSFRLQPEACSLSLSFNANAQKPPYPIRCLSTSSKRILVSLALSLSPCICLSELCMPEQRSKIGLNRVRSYLVGVARQGRCLLTPWGIQDRRHAHAGCVIQNETHKMERKVGSLHGWNLRCLSLF